MNLMPFYKEMVLSMDKPIVFSTPKGVGYLWADKELDVILARFLFWNSKDSVTLRVNELNGRYYIRPNINGKFPMITVPAFAVKKLKEEMAHD